MESYPEPLPTGLRLETRTRHGTLFREVDRGGTKGRSMSPESFFKGRKEEESSMTLVTLSLTFCEGVRRIYFPSDVNNNNELRLYF